MTWIKTIPFSEADEKLREAIERQRALYTPEYGPPTAINPDDSAGVVGDREDGSLPEEVDDRAVRVASGEPGVYQLVVGKPFVPETGDEPVDAGLGPTRRLRLIAVLGNKGSR